LNTTFGNGHSRVGLGDDETMTILYGILGLLCFALGAGVIGAIIVSVTSGLGSAVWLVAGSALPVISLFWLSFIFFRHGDQRLRHKQYE
jgi:hypothetical protein